MAGTTQTFQLPYPTLPDSYDVARDIKALADRLETLLGTPKFTAPAIRVRNPANQTGFGAVTWTGMNWVTDYVKGPGGVFTVAGGVVTVAVAGEYRVNLQLTALGTQGSPRIRAQLVDLPSNPTVTYVDTYAPTELLVANGGDSVWLEAGSTVAARLYNYDGKLTVAQDTPVQPCAFTIVRYAGS